MKLEEYKDGVIQASKHTLDIYGAAKQSQNLNKHRDI
jgi:hypothetical protein